MKTIGSTFNLAILLHCYTRPERFPQRDNTDYRIAINNLLIARAIVPSHVGDGFYEITQLGAAWVRTLLNAPLPNTNQE